VRFSLSFVLFKQIPCDQPIPCQKYHKAYGHTQDLKPRIALSLSAQGPVVHLKAKESDMLVSSTFSIISEKSSLLRTFDIQTLKKTKYHLLSVLVTTSYELSIYFNVELLYAYCTYSFLILQLPQRPLQRGRAVMFKPCNTTQLPPVVTETRHRVVTPGVDSNT